jgi:tripartite-type tricarboxylate transporter receptor subunit TctC
MLTISRRAFIAAAAVAAQQGTSSAWAQGSYPDRPIKLLVPFPAGALTDTLGRLIADQLRHGLGQPVVVENRPGAGTLLGASAVAKSAPDGYTLMVATSTTLAISPAMYSAPPATAADFTGVAMIGSVSLILVARPDLKVNNLKELVQAMRESPGKLNFGSPGTGTMHHLIIETLKSQEKVDATHVPYQGSMAALTDLLTGRIDFMFLDAVAAMPQIRAEKIKPLAVAASRRAAALPQVATVTETYPAIDLQAWQSIAAPKATPAAVVLRLNTEINKYLQSPEGRRALQQVGVDAWPLSVPALNEVIAKDAKRLGQVVRAAGLKAA